MKIIDKEVFKRLDSVRETWGIPQSQMASILDIEAATYSGMKAGKSGVSAKVLKKLADKGVNIEYIKTGIGSMFVQDENSTSLTDVEEAARNYMPGNLTEKVNNERMLKLLELSNEHVARLIKSIEVRDENERQLIHNLTLKEESNLVKEEINRINAITINNLTNELFKNKQKLGGEK